VSEEEQIRWRKLRAQLHGFWVFVYAKEKGWHVHPNWQRGATHGFFDHMPDASSIFLGWWSQNDAEETAQSLAASPNWQVAAVVDFTGKDFPRVSAWYYNDGSSTRKFDKAPKSAFEQSLTKCLRHLH
jgi:hypothetical protein